MTTATGVRIGVLLPVHPGVPAAQLSAALGSLVDQTRPPDEVVVVEDGPLPDDLTALLDTLDPGCPVQRVPLPRPSGIAVALQTGLDATTTPWVARMDSDDVNEPRRLEVQAAALRDAAYDVLGSAVLEFEDDPARPTALRVMPEQHEEIARRLRTSNPVNHPTVVFRREAALDAGGYRALAGLEDYDLWARMLARGARFHNLPEPLVRFRGGSAMLGRRRDLAVLRAEVTLQRRLRSLGVVSAPRAVVNVVARTAFRLLPLPLMSAAYRRLFLRRP